MVCGQGEFPANTMEAIANCQSSSPWLVFFTDQYLIFMCMFLLLVM